jgi:hypothetical protein
MEGKMELALLPAAPTEDGSQRRQSPHRQVIKGALIVFQKGNCSMRCRILDLSETGAMLAPIDILLCPREFVLKPDVGEPRNCEVRWRKADRLGVPFF